MTQVQSRGPARAGRAPYAAFWEESRGRLIEEADSATRSPYQRDRDRIVHSTAFRRLTHKTQVFIYHEGDHYRTRLTHSLEVAQIARSMARTLGLDEDLAEAIALAHDLGHTPFGHAGESALDAAMAQHGGFDHNAQSLRIVTQLERRYAGFDGLNLTWETLEGIAKHNGPLEGNSPYAIGAYTTRHDLGLANWPSAEAQLAAIADDIAYSAHDLDDGYRAGFFSLDELEAMPLMGALIGQIRDAHPGAEGVRLLYEINRRLITRLVNAAVTSTMDKIDRDKLQTVDDIRESGGSVCHFSDSVMADMDTLRAFLNDRVYHHSRIARIMSDARTVLEDLFACYMNDPVSLPDEWRVEAVHDDGDDTHARLVCDFIAGMTDRYALREHRRLFDATPELR